MKTLLKKLSVTQIEDLEKKLNAEIKDNYDKLGGIRRKNTNMLRNGNPLPDHAIWSDGYYEGKVSSYQNLLDRLEDAKLNKI